MARVFFGGVDADPAFALLLFDSRNSELFERCEPMPRRLPGQLASRGVSHEVVNVTVAVSLRNGTLLAVLRGLSGSHSWKLRGVRH